jgi:hypothetical protein
MRWRCDAAQPQAARRAGLSREPRYSTDDAANEKPWRYFQNGGMKMQSKRSTTALWAVGLLSAASACSGTNDALTSSQSEAETVTRTIVRTQRDGSVKIEKSVISRAEQLQEIAAKENLAKAAATPGFRLQDIVFDTSCAASSMWLFHGWFLDGSEMCFFQDGNTGGTQWGDNGFEQVDLSAWNWYVPGQGTIIVAGSVNSAWAGSDAACLSIAASTVDPGGNFYNFRPWDQIRLIPFEADGINPSIANYLDISPGGSTHYPICAY